MEKLRHQQQTMNLHHGSALAKTGETERNTGDVPIIKSQLKTVAQY
jgi:hypothetical protein